MFAPQINISHNTTRRPRRPAARVTAARDTRDKKRHVMLSWLRPRWRRCATFESDVQLNTTLQNNPQLPHSAIQSLRRVGAEGVQYSASTQCVGHKQRKVWERNKKLGTSTKISTTTFCQILQEILLIILIQITSSSSYLLSFVVL